MRLWYLIKEGWGLIRRYRLYLILPVLLALLLLTVVAFYVGPAAVVTFIYSGI